MNNPNPPHHTRHAAGGPQPARPQPAYPLARPADTDPRFSIGLAIKVAKVLTEHGYPPLAGGADLQHWQRVLFTGIYTGTNHREETLP
jgi:hypothetical protein